MASRSATAWVAAEELSYIDPKTGRNVPVGKGEIYNGPNPEKYHNEGLVVPAPAGSSQPGNQDDGSSQ